MLGIYCYHHPNSVYPQCKHQCALPLINDMQSTHPEGVCMVALDFSQAHLKQFSPLLSILSREVRIHWT